MRVDDEGVRHPTADDEVTLWELHHVLHCPECQDEFSALYGVADVADILDKERLAEERADAYHLKVAEVRMHNEPVSKDVRKWWQWWK